MKKLTDYKNFWLVWLSSAGSDRVTLFKIQKYWSIKTNYLYHNERGLGKPLFKAMIDQGYLEKEGKFLRAKFDWIPDFILNKRKMPSIDKWSPNIIFIENWPKVQQFLRKSSKILFNMDNLKILYKDAESIKKTGEFIFDDIYLLVLTYNITPFCKKYKADIVTRIMYTIISLASDRGLLPYFQEVNEAKINIPLVIREEEALEDILSPLQAY